MEKFENRMKNISDQITQHKESKIILSELQLLCEDLCKIVPTLTISKAIEVKNWIRQSSQQYCIAIDDLDYGQQVVEHFLIISKLILKPVSLNKPKQIEFGLLICGLDGQVANCDSYCEQIGVVCEENFFDFIDVRVKTKEQEIVFEDNIKDSAIYFYKLNLFSIIQTLREMKIKDFVVECLKTPESYFNCFYAKCMLRKFYFNPQKQPIKFEESEQQNMVIVEISQLSFAKSTLLELYIKSDAFFDKLHQVSLRYFHENTESD
ncbi:hypothetical protein pb186bvf_002301 [Paramecium bursaria]